MRPSADVRFLRRRWVVGVSIDPDAKPGQHARVRQVRVAAEVDARNEVLAANRHVKASDIIREALAAYLASAVSQGDKGASRTRRSRTVVPAKAARVRSPAKAVSRQLRRSACR